MFADMLDTMSKDIKDVETFLDNKFIYYDIIFDCDIEEKYYLKWDGKDKRIWLIKTPNPCYLSQVPVDDRVKAFCFLPKFLEFVLEDAEKKANEMQIVHVSTTIRQKLKFYKANSGA